MSKDFLVAEVKALKASDDAPHGAFEAILSMPEVDRDGEIIDAGAFNPLPNSIPIFGDHVASIATTVGRAVPVYDGPVLKVSGRFDGDEYSQLVRSKLQSGSVTTMSVGFMSPDREQDANGIPHIKSAELLEGSFVPIPSLREATVTAVKSLVSKVGARNSSKDSEYLQTAHDALVKAGATCKAADDESDDGKALGRPQIDKQSLLSLAADALAFGDHKMAEAAMEIVRTV